MLDVVFGTIMLFFAFATIGIGPALLLTNSREHLKNSCLISPAIGLVITSLIGTYLVQLNYPVSSWAFPWLIIGILVSLIMSIIAFKTKANALNIDKNIRYYLIGLLFIICVLLIPVAIDGLNFTVLRGNGTDAFNYITMAGYLLHEPYAWFLHAKIQTLIDAHPSYALAKQLLTSRWSTSMLLAWSSKITHIPLYRLEYGFTALFFMIMYGCAYRFSSILKIPLKYVLLLSITVAVGFWGQFVLVLRAMSEISALPLLLLLAVLIAKIDEKPNNTEWGARVLLGLTFTAIAFLYAEIIPTVIFGLIIYVFLQFLHKNYSLLQIKRHCISIIIAILTFLPAAPQLSKFFFAQLLMAASFKNNWQHSYFQWLYHYPLNGFWGLSYFIELSKQFNFNKVIIISSHIILSAISITLFLIFIFTIKNTLLSKKKKPVTALILTISFVLAILIEFGFLFCKGQLWAAGKGLSYGYPFILITTTAGIILLQNKANLKVYILSACKYIVLIWLSIQCIVGAYLIIEAHQAKYHPFISDHGEYRQHDWDITTFIKTLKNNKCSSLGIYVSDDWAAEYFGFVFGWNMHVINLDGIKSRDGKLIGIQKLTPTPQYLIVEKNSFFAKQHEILENNKEFVLIKSTPTLLRKIITKTNKTHNIAIDNKTEIKK